MKRVEWQPYLSVGVAEIDRQHRVLFEHYNAFFAAYREGLAAEELVRLFGFLEAYVVTHFADEEKLQQQVGFPGYAKHREHHQALTQQVLELKERLLSDGATSALVGEVSLLMTGWLIEHISVMDRAVGRFVIDHEHAGARRLGG
jgi:hemerythrin